MKKIEKKNKRFIIFIAGIFCIAAGVFLAVLFGSQKEKQDQNEENIQGIVASLESYKGYIRTVSSEEYDFYKYFVERDLTKAVSADELDQMIKDYINEVNAVFYLGNKLGLYESYSFDLLKLRMEQENRDRQLKLEKGEVVYGLEQFTLETFYQYERENLENDIIDYIMENADQSLIDQAEQYYDENKEAYKERESVAYEITYAGETTEEESDRNELDILGNADETLADFLEQGQIGESYTDTKDGEERTVVITGISYVEPDFEEDMSLAVRTYIRYQLFDEIIATVAENNPVEFESA